MFVIWFINDFFLLSTIHSHLAVPDYLRLLPFNSEYSLWQIKSSLTYMGTKIFIDLWIKWWKICKIKIKFDKNLLNQIFFSFIEVFQKKNWDHFKVQNYEQQITNKQTGYIDDKWQWILNDSHTTDKSKVSHTKIKRQTKF